MVPLSSNRVSRARPYSCHIHAITAYGAITHSGAGFQQLLLLRKYALACSPFARHYWGNLMLMSFPVGTEMFHFPTFASIPLCIHG
jgi:hypothetical protein